LQCTTLDMREIPDQVRNDVITHRLHRHSLQTECDKESPYLSNFTLPDPPLRREGKLPPLIYKR
jgi:hypothetical protein